MGEPSCSEVPAGWLAYARFWARANSSAGRAVGREDKLRKARCCPARRVGRWATRRAVGAIVRASMLSFSRLDPSRREGEKEARADAGEHDANSTDRDREARNLKSPAPQSSACYVVAMDITVESSTLVDTTP